MGMILLAVGATETHGIHTARSMPKGVKQQLDFKGCLGTAPYPPRLLLILGPFYKNCLID